VTSEPLRVLVVCLANVCRSRTAQVLLQDALSRAGVDVAVGSAGLRAVAGAPACASMVRLLAERPLDLDTATGARRVTRELLEAQDLVLVPERGHRAALARMHPAGRARTFPMLEAAGLATALPSARSRHAVPGGAAVVRDHLLERVRAMDLARGKVDLAAPDAPRSGGLRGLLGGRTGEPPLDVVDVHGGSLRDHRRTLTLMDGSIASLVHGLTD
jgi:protein-tyrosine-phosphatase